MKRTLWMASVLVLAFAESVQAQSRCTKTYGSTYTNRCRPNCVCEFQRWRIDCEDGTTYSGVDVISETCDADGGGGELPTP